jgi:hypothetical protein
LSHEVFTVCFAVENLKGLILYEMRTANSHRRNLSILSENQQAQLCELLDKMPGQPISLHYPEFVYYRN